MSDLTVNGRRLNPATVVRLKPGEELAAAAAARTNGADDLIVKIGQDHFAISGRGMAVDKVKPNDAVKLDGKEGRVVAVDKQLNTFGEGMLAWPGLAVGGVGAVWGVGGFVQGMLAGANMAGLGLIIAAGAVAVGVAINLAPALFGAFRKTDESAIGKHAA